MVRLARLALVGSISACGSRAAAVPPGEAQRNATPAAEDNAGPVFAGASDAIESLRFSPRGSTLRLSATLGSDLQRELGDDDVWVAARCQDGDRVISSRKVSVRPPGRARSVSAALRGGLDRPPTRCNIRIFTGDFFTGQPDAKAVVAGAYCLEGSALAPGECAAPIEAKPANHQHLSVTHWDALRRPDGFLASRSACTTEHTRATSRTPTWSFAAQRMPAASSTDSRSPP